MCDLLLGLRNATKREHKIWVYLPLIKRNLLNHTGNQSVMSKYYFEELHFLKISMFHFKYYCNLNILATN